MLASDAMLIQRAIYQPKSLDWRTVMLPSWLADLKLMKSGVEDCRLSFSSKKDNMLVLSFLAAAYGSENADNEKIEAYIARFIKQGCSVNAFDKEGMTPLHLAVLYNQPELVKFLLENNAEQRKKIIRPGGIVNGMQPLKFARFLHASNDSQQLKDIINIFTNKK